MGLKTMLSKSGHHVELYYMGTFIARIKADESNRTSQAAINMALHSDIKVVFKKPIEQKQYLDENDDSVNFNK